MAEDELENPLDDELLAELGLEPKPAPKPGKEAPSKKKGTTSVPEFSPPAGPSERVAAPEASFKKEIKNLTQDMPVQLVAVLGKKTIALKDIVSLKPGEIVDLKKLPNDLVDLVANGKLVAKGELVLVEGKVGIQIRQLA